MSAWALTATGGPQESPYREKPGPDEAVDGFTVAMCDAETMGSAGVGPGERSTAPI
jgi:hypothetical protein